MNPSPFQHPLSPAQEVVFLRGEWKCREKLMEREREEHGPRFEPFVPVSDQTVEGPCKGHTAASCSKQEFP